MSMYDSYNKAVYEKFPNLPQSGECGERMAVLKHLDPNAKVLEIGANIGGVSSLIAAVLNDPNNLIAVEPIESTCEGLCELGKSLNTPFRTFAGVIQGEGKPKLNCTGSKNSYAHCVESDNPKTENLSIDEIEKKFNITFTTVIIDCEGCYTSFLSDILKKPSITQIQIEWDGPMMESDILLNGFECVAIYQHCCLEHGVRVYNRK